MACFKRNVKSFLPLAVMLTAACVIPSCGDAPAEKDARKKKAPPRPARTINPRAQQFFLSGVDGAKEKQYERAYQDFRTACLLDPTNERYRFNWARAAYETKRFTRAVEILQDLLATNPKLARAKYELARSYLALGITDMAAQYFREAQADLKKRAPKDDGERKLFETILKRIDHSLAEIEKKKKR